MCEVCVATKALEETVEHKTNDGRIIQIRAKGEGPEFKPAEFQLRYVGNKWPAAWHETKDLAGTFGELMLDMHDELATPEIIAKRAAYLK